MKAKTLEEVVNKKSVPKTQKEKFERLERVNPLLRELAKTFDLVIKI